MYYPDKGFRLPILSSLLRGAGVIGKSESAQIFAVAQDDSRGSEHGIFMYANNLNAIKLRLQSFLPLQGGGQEGDGVVERLFLPHPHPALPLKGREILFAAD